MTSTHIMPHIKYPTGLYVSARFSQATTTALLCAMETLGINNPINEADLHCTILYSETPVADFDMFDTELQLEQPIIALPHSFDVFGDDSECLVLKISSPRLFILHHTIKNRTGSVHSFPQYNPHITLSYEFQGEQVPRCNVIDLVQEPIEIVSLHAEPLDPDW